MPFSACALNICPQREGGIHFMSQFQGPWPPQEPQQPFNSQPTWSGQPLPQPPPQQQGKKPMSKQDKRHLAIGCGIFLAAFVLCIGVASAAFHGAPSVSATPTATPTHA